MRTWLEIPALEAIDLTNSYVLSWNQSQNAVRFIMDFVLTQDHPLYTLPQDDEWACFRSGELVFSGATRITGLYSMDDVKPAIGATGEKDYGCIDSLVEIGAGQYEVEGEFGTVSIKSEEPRVLIRANDT
jgi:hypothetical protein